MSGIAHKLSGAHATRTRRNENETIGDRNNTMRLRIRTTPNEQPVPFSYQHFLTGAFHKWLGANDLHDRISLYSLSWLDGGRRVNNHLAFPNGASWFISSFEDKVLIKLVNSIFADPYVCCGMRVIDIEQQDAPEFGARYKFKASSPVLAKGKPDENGRVKYFLYDEPEADEIITATLRHKMDVAQLGSEHKNVRVRFDHEYRNAKTRLVRIKNIEMRASSCPVIVEGTPEAVQFAWNVGVGNGTGSCFGSLKE